MMVSVVITCFNYGRYLKKCLDSVLAQSVGDFEVVVIDDGSTDDTAEVIRPFRKDSRIRFHYQANQGQTIAKNTGIQLSQGELIAFLDADDYWEPNKLERQLPLFANRAVGVTYTGFYFTDLQDRCIPADPPAGYLAYRRGNVTRWLGFDNFVPFSAAMIRRSLLDAHGSFDPALRMGIDWDLWLRMSCETEFDFVPDQLIAYRVGHANQMSKNKAGRFAAADLIFDRFVAQHPGAMSEADLRELEFYNACSRAAAFRSIDLARSTGLLLKAWRLRPWSSAPYRGMLRNARAMISRQPS
jgi:glycosyltransferase involved in cell wall biosynthesis